LAKLFAYRIKNLLPKIIKDDQTGFIPNRFIGCNVNRLLDAMDHCQENKIEAMLVSIDFQKAFDTMEWEFVYKAMEYYGFPITFINWIRVMYININSCVLNNGHISELFYPTRGVRQGCPLSPYLFVIGAEILAEYIRRSADIPSIPITAEYSNVSQYADDTTVITLRKGSILKSLFNILDDYSKISGLKVNIEKTQVMPIGFNLNNITELSGYAICDSMCVLGVSLCCDKSKMMDINYTPVLKKIKNCFHIWNQRQLSLFGRIEIAKTLGISRLVYLLTLLPKPGNDLLDTIEKEMLKFVWKYKTPKIRSTIIKNKKDLAGTGMVDIKLKEICLKLSWLPKLIHCSGAWKAGVINALSLSENVLEYFLNGNIKKEDLPSKLDRKPFWKEIFLNWSHINYTTADSLYYITDILKSNIWYNSCIKIKNKIVFWDMWYQAGVKEIVDLINPISGNFYNWEELRNKYKLPGIYLHFYSILSAIPQCWKRKIKEVFQYRYEEQNVGVMSLNEKLLTFPKPVGILYRDMINNVCKDQPQDRAEKWSSDLDWEVDDLDWFEVLHESYRCTNSQYIRSFIYKFAMRAIYPNYMLHKMKLQDSPKCPKCKSNDDTLIHMFWECPSTQVLYVNLLSWIKTNLNIKLPMVKQTLLLYMDLEVDVDEYQIIILMLTLCKIAIYQNVSSHVPVTLDRVVKIIYRYEKIERYNATAVQNIQKHRDKWQNIHRMALTNEENA